MRDTSEVRIAVCASADDYNATARRKVSITAPATAAARQWQGWGTALKPALEPITMARKPFTSSVAANVVEHGTGAINVDGCRVGDAPAGRWPANLIHDDGHDVQQVLGDASRFFYCPKASSSDRGEKNIHPTVKPTDLMRYLCRLVTQPAGVVLDPFMGSGSTGKAAVLEGFSFVGIERDPQYFEIAKRRVQPQKESSSVGQSQLW
jgi:site-specific DNA-methyltransferase (adenine-specific)